MLGTLPESLRVTAMLRYFGRHAAYAEIAATLGTVRSRLSQVKSRLGAALLETAALAHDEASRLRTAQEHHFAAATDELNRAPAASST